MVCPALLDESWGWIMDWVTTKGCSLVNALFNYLPEMISDELDNALAPICNRYIKRIGGKFASSFLVNIFGTRSLTQLLWYARPSYVGVSPGFLFRWVLEDILSDTITDDLNKSLLAISNQLNKNMAERLRRLFLLKYFRHSFFHSFLWCARPY